MRPIIAATIGSCLSAVLLAAPVIAATPAPHGRPRAEPAAATNPPQSACPTGAMDHHRLLSRAAYVPGESASPLQCAHLLSTDTMLIAHPWARS